MTHRSMRRGLLIATCVAALTAGLAVAQSTQEDAFATFRKAPAELQGLFRDQPAQQRDLGEAVRVLVESRVKRGGAARAHVLMAFDGPLSAEMRADLENNGIRILDKLDDQTWIASVDQEGAEFAAKGGPIRGATVVPPQVKMSGLISLQRPFDWQRREGQEGLGYSVLFHKGVSAEEALSALSAITDDKIQGIDPAAFPYVRQLDVALTEEQLAAAAALDVVQFIEPQAPPNEDQNRNNTQPVSNVDDVQIAPYNLSGAGVTVGVWEAGDTIRATHQDLTPRVTVQPGQTASQDGHALHVAGTIGASGVNSAASEGMAPATTILSWDSTNDAAEMAVAAAAGAANRVIASNHSYGAVIGWNNAGTNLTPNQNLFGQYTNRSVAFDTVVAGDGAGVAATELVVLKAAGNDRGDGPNNPANPDDCRQGGLGIDADCIGPVGVAKNVITVGAMNGNALIAGFSGFGPTDDGRIKPDIMANGTNVTSLGDFGVPPGGGAPTDDIAQTDTGTWQAQGTSMATPAVTGIVSLMFEELGNQGITGIPLAASIKAILIQTALDVAGTGQAQVGPDYATGWGIADAQAAIDLLRRAGGPGYAEGTVSATGGGGAWDFPFVVPAGQPELHVTLAWSDLPGTPAGAGSELVNDLDLRLIPPGGGAAQQPWTLNAANPGQAAVRNGGDDALNTVEQVSVLNPAAGTWTAQVTAKAGSLALGPQRFAIAGPITPDSGPIAGPKANIMMVLDKSGSMALPAATPGLNKMQAMQNAATAFVDYIELVGGHNLGLVAFNANVVATSPNFGLQALDGTSAGNARTAIGNLAPGGLTGIIAGVTEASTQLGGGAASNPDDVVFLFSDGRHNRPVGSNVATIDAVMANDTRFFSIGFGTDVDSTVMPGVAANHDGVHLEEQGLQAGQLAKLFMVVGGLAADETIVIDPDYAVNPGGSANQGILANPADRSLTFAAFWNEQNADKFSLQLFGPNKRCRVPMKKHQGFDMRRGRTYALVRIELPYKCVAGEEDALMHEGSWRLNLQNRGQTADTAKVMVLSDSGITLRPGSRTGGQKALLTARLIEGDRLLRKGVRVIAHIRPNRPSSGDSEKQDGITGDNPGVKDPTRPTGGLTASPVLTIRRDEPTVVAPATTLVKPQASTAGSASLNPAVASFLEARAKAMQLSPEVMAQLQGRFTLAPKPTGVELRDDGTNGDARANDGVFSVMVELPEKGLYQVRTVATQARPDGMLTREALSSLVMQ